MSDLVKRLRRWKPAWGDLPSIAPHAQTAPGLTTGGVIGDAEEAADRIEQLEAQLAAADKLARTLDGTHIFMDTAKHRSAARHGGGSRRGRCTACRWCPSDDPFIMDVEPPPQTAFHGLGLRGRAF